MATQVRRPVTDLENLRSPLPVWSALLSAEAGGPNPANAQQVPLGQAVLHIWICNAIDAESKRVETSELVIVAHPTVLCACLTCQHPPAKTKCPVLHLYTLPWTTAQITQ
eukprot:6340379-Amphidinium_carterae.2